MTTPRRTRSLLSRLTAVLAVAVLPVTAVHALPPETQTRDVEAQTTGARAYDRVVDITFPVAGPTRYIDDYHQDRGGGTRKHRATDVMADHGQKVHAAMGGVISFITGMNDDPPSYGYMIAIAGDDGLRYSYIHLGRQDGRASQAYASGMRQGVRVKRGQHIGYVGSSGNAHPDHPHLHFEIEDAPDTVDPYGSHRLNPYASLRDAERRGDLPGAPAQPAPNPAPEPEPSPAPEPEPEPEPEPDPCAPDGDPDAGPVGRVAGEQRIATAVQVSARYWDEASDVVVATARDYADALAGGALAARRGAPMLLTDHRGLPDAVADEISRLRPRTAWILGGEQAVSAQVEEQIRDLGPAVRRVAHDNRFGTAARIAEEVHERSRRAVVALGRHPEDPARAWPDAVAAGALAATPERVPTLLINRRDVPPATEQALAALGVEEVLVVGGLDAVRPAAEERLNELGYTVRRLAGDSRYATSAAVAREARRAYASATPMVFASGAGFADALSAGGLAAKIGGPLLLVPPCGLEQADAIRHHVQSDRDQIELGVVVGGEVAVSERVRWQLGEALRD